MPTSGNTTWQDSPSTATPITSARLQAIETALTASAPKRYLDIVTDYGVTTGMTSAARTTAIQTAINDAIATNTPLHIPTGQWTVSGTLNARGAYLKMFGDGMYNSRIKCSGTNVPILQVGGDFQRFDGFSLEYTAQQASTATNANCVEHWGSKFSHFSDIYTYAGARHWYIPQAESSTGSGINTGAFSNVYTNLRGLGATINFINMVGFVGFWTGNVWSNIYFNNKTTSTILGITGPVIHFGNGDENVILQANVEDVDLSIAGSPDKLIQLSNRATTLNGLHFERVKLAATGATCVHLGSLAKVNASAVSYVWSDVTDTTKGNRSLFRLFQGRLEVHGLNLHNVQKESGCNVYIVDVMDNAQRAKAAVTMSDYDVTCSSNSSMGTTGVTWATGAFFTGNAVNDTTSVVTVS